MWHGVRLAWGSLRANRFDWIFSLISDILAKSTPGSFYHCTKYQSNGFDYACFNEHWASTEFWSSKYFSAAQMLKLANTFFDFLLKYRPSPEVFYYFLILAIYIYPCTLQIFRPMLLGICPWRSPPMTPVLRCGSRWLSSCGWLYLVRWLRNRKCWILGKVFIYVVCVCVCVCVWANFLL